MQAANPEENIQIRPNDVISVPRADLVYVLGEVKKPGGFIVTDRDNLSVLQALALAEGLGKTSSAANSKILRAVPGSSRTEIPINVKKILNGKESDVALKPDDILFIPNSSAKTFVTKAIEGAIAAGTGVMIYGRNGW
jgi:polysaccharide export outer membrane protein